MKKVYSRPESHLVDIKTSVSLLTASGTPSATSLQLFTPGTSSSTCIYRSDIW